MKNGRLEIFLPAQANPFLPKQFEKSTIFTGLFHMPLLGAYKDPTVVSSANDFNGGGAQGTGLYAERIRKTTAAQKIVDFMQNLISFQKIKVSSH